jgi:hypothetical protein
MRKVPDKIKKPEYAQTGELYAERSRNVQNPHNIEVKKPETIAKMRRVCLVYLPPPSCQRCAANLELPSVLFQYISRKICIARQNVHS